MHLREGCGTERRRIDAGEHLAYGAAIFLRQRVDDDLIRHRVGIGAQLRELVAERLRQNLRPHGQYLPDLDECGAQCSSISLIFTGVRPCTTSNWFAMRMICPRRLTFPRLVR